MADRPYIYLKYAMSLDGKIATSSGNSKWITGPEARREAHRLRNRVHGLMVGAGTIRADNPGLTTRLEDEPCRHPIRIVLSVSGQIDPTARVFQAQTPGNTTLFTVTPLPTHHERMLREHGIGFFPMPLIPSSNTPDLPRLLASLYGAGMKSIMVEGGSGLLTSFMQQRLFDEVWTFIAPKIIGGKTAPTPFDGLGFDKVTHSPDMETYETKTLGNDLLIKTRRCRQT